MWRLLGQQQHSQDCDHRWGYPGSGRVLGPVTRIVWLPPNDPLVAAEAVVVLEGSRFAAVTWH